MDPLSDFLFHFILVVLNKPCGVELQKPFVCRHIVYKVGADRKRKVVGKYHYTDADLQVCTGMSAYPDNSARFGYMNSFAVTENYIVLPTTGYLHDPCFYSMFKGRVISHIYLKDKKGRYMYIFHAHFNHNTLP